ncbi:MAG: rod shape-determining protein MreD [Candidatus Hydrogenedentes bacterium]|nr:rod shape-determining protein MreD [Candidatus Hydrogenedentota bacterium]
MMPMATVRKNAIWLFAVVLAAMLETTWIERIRLLDVVPNLTLLMVVFFAIIEGEERAMFTGAIGGIFQDVASNAALGHHIFCNVIVGYAAARVASRMITEHPAAKAALVFSATIVFGLLFVGVTYVQDPATAAFRNIVERVVPESFYTALFTPVMFFLLDRVFRKPKREWTLNKGAV